MRNCSWKFDNCDGNSESKNYVHLTDLDGPLLQQLSVVMDNEKKLIIEAHRDQWGTWITFKIDESEFTVAQEDQTMSFLGALIAGLKKIKEDTEFETIESELIDGIP